MHNNLFKYYFLHYLVIIFALFQISACSDEKVKGPGLNEKLKFNSNEYNTHLRSALEQENLFYNHVDSVLKYYDTLKSLYITRNYAPLFIESFDNKSLVDSLLMIFKNAGEHGLEPDDYHSSPIYNEFYAAINDKINSSERYSHLVKSEILLSDAILKYAYHMRYGVVDPKELFPDSYYLPSVDSAGRDLFEPLEKDNIVKYLYAIQPNSERYQKLQTALKEFYNYKDLDWPKISIPSKKIEPGDSFDQLKIIADKLTILHFLDTTKIKIINYEIYDSLLFEPVKAFQKARGLVDDGIIGKATIEWLNVTPKEYIKKIKLNLERFRWLDYSDTAQYVLVNIPDFRLHINQNGEELFDIKVCTGRKRPASYEALKKNRIKVDDWETPMLYSQISYLVLNPTWTVPPSIIKEEIASGLRRDSAYLIKRNFKVYKNGVSINVNEVNVNELSGSSMPYRIVQDPGAGNALGKIKFMFKNPFGVYLHDTPSRLAFTYSNRAVSHGCVRVEKPLQLAEFILNDNSSWNMNYLKLEIGQKIENKDLTKEFYQKRDELRKNSSYGRTTEVKLHKNIPLFIDYYTAWVSKDGIMNFRDDVYRKDKVLSQNLFPEDQEL